MKNNTALIEHKTMVLFNFLSLQHKKDKRIGELSIQDIQEIIEFLITESSHEKN